MSLYIRRQFNILVAEAQNMNNPLVSRGSSEERIDAIATQDECTSAKLVIAGEASDQELPLGPGVTTGKFFFIETDQDITIKFNDIGNTAYSVKVPAVTTTTVKGRLAGDFEFTAVYVSVPGTTDANIIYGVIGA